MKKTTPASKQMVLKSYSDPLQLKFKKRKVWGSESNFRRKGLHTAS